ncbi:AraC family transcriptional regulator [Shewanella mangrovisoli]|uniref:AraC family transcriptional regulator n=1 Tax=Shewanella mangrovisoli TaxID=2864211 RepID=UPI0035B9F6A8
MSDVIPKATMLAPSQFAFTLDANRPVLSNARNLEAEMGVEPHSHPRGQLLWAAKGILRVQSDNAVWVVPSTHAVWLPSGCRHQINCETQAHLRNLYIDPSYRVRVQDTQVVMVTMTPLMREMVLKLCQDATMEPAKYFRLGLSAIDELDALDSVNTYLNAGSDPRLGRVIQLLIKKPQAEYTLAELAQSAGASIRTIERLFKAETGQTYRQWRQRYRLLNSLERLTQGESTTSVAHSLGYLSVSSFSAAFKVLFGCTPQEYAQKSVQATRQHYHI